MAARLVSMAAFGPRAAELPGARAAELAAPAERPPASTAGPEGRVQAQNIGGRESHFHVLAILGDGNVDAGNLAARGNDWRAAVSARELPGQMIKLDASLDHCFQDAGFNHSKRPVFDDRTEELLTGGKSAGSIRALGVQKL